MDCNCGAPRPVKYRVQRHECEGWTVYDANTGVEFASGFETSTEAWKYVSGLIGACPITRAAAGGPAVLVPDVGKRSSDG